MICDWQIFWWQHYQHEECSEFDLAKAVMDSTFNVFKGLMTEQFVPAMQKACLAMSQFNAAVSEFSGRAKFERALRASRH